VRFKWLLIISLIVATVLLYKYGRAIWYPVYLKLAGTRTVENVVQLYGVKSRAALHPYFNDAGITYPPQALTLLAIKDTGVVEVWATSRSGNTMIRTYPIKAQSGVAGPKLREGDHQVPEGIYQIVGLNPNSSFHLSMKLNYPNEFDLKYAKQENRDQPGSNIFIHGKAASVGCLAMGDPAIEELFVLVNDVGRQNVKVIIAPTDPREAPLKRLNDISWSDELYTEIEREFSQY